MYVCTLLKFKIVKPNVFSHCAVTSVQSIFKRIYIIILYDYNYNL